MENIKKTLQYLISISKDTKRKELYKNFSNELNSINDIEQKEIVNEMYKNFAGLTAYAELEKNEYDTLKLLFEQIEQNL
jgi:tRNA C32,U32 (ribose-2'-O)-methylase TrmJ